MAVRFRLGPAFTLTRVISFLLVTILFPMAIESTVVDAYINHYDMIPFKESWYFSSSILDMDEGKNIFVLPPDDDNVREDVKRLRDAFYSVIEDFEPLNRPIWDSLFPSWEDKKANIDLIVGFPEPYDAVNTHSPDGKSHLVFDLCCWRGYLTLPDTEKLILNVVTHELTHYLIGCYYPEADMALESKDYLEKLDAYTFHEGFAHLISYNASDIDKTDWHSENLESVYTTAKEKMNLALREKDREKQKKFLYDAICGKYYDKFACMCGMLYLARVWEKRGTAGLKEEFSSFHGFAKKTLSDES